MKFGKKEVLLIYVLSFSFFFASTYSQIQFLQQIALTLLVFLLPGFFFAILLDKINFLKLMLYSVVSSISIIIFATIIINIFAKIPFGTNFLYILFLVTTLPQIILLIVDKKMQPHLPDLSINKWLLGIIMFSVIVETILFLKIGSLMGADVGRFTIVSHIYFLEKNIVTNLQPYDMADRYFYFPGVTVLPAILEIAGINAIDGFTFIALVINLATIVAFYFFSKELIPEYAVHATLFFAFLFNTPLYFILFAFQPFGMSYLFLFTALSILLMKFFNRTERNFPVLVFAFLGIIFFHPYVVFLFLTFLAALLIYDFVDNGKKIPGFIRIIKFGLAALLVSVILFSPYLYYFKDSLTISFNRLNKLDILSYRPIFLFGFLPSQALRDIFTVLFSIPVGFIDPIYLVIAFVIFLLSLKKIMHNEKKILAIFFILTIGMNYLASVNINLSRFLTSTSIFYPMVMPNMLNYMPLNFLFIGASIFFNSPSVLFYLKNLQPMVDTGLTVRTVVWPEFNDAANFIKKNTPENSTFLIDGGGAGCLGFSSSYGERIFPLTSRKIFYFTNYCWADYNRTDYSARVDVYRKIAENPSDLQAVQMLKNYGVTHVYVGPDDFVLNSTLFLNSAYFKEIFHENSTYIFKLN